MPYLRDAEPWPCPSGGALPDPEALRAAEAGDYCRGRAWQWPQRPVHFFSDLHADARAFVDSLVMARAAERTGPGDGDFCLTESGQRSLFVIGGDCFDKGPSTLGLLRALRGLIDLGADVKILAGNHDLRTYVGLAHAGRREPHLAHLFVRLGGKSAALFREIYDESLRGAVGTDVHEDQAHAWLFPQESWFREFPLHARGRVPEVKIAKELARIREKIAEIESRCRELGLSLGMLARAVQRCRELFMTPEGEFSWYFRRMTLAHREGSFLFVHAGVDDRVAQVLAEEDVAGLNTWYHRLFDEDLFELYHGPVGNTFRTKYREGDFSLSRDGVEALGRAGLHAVVHGHKNLPRGQRLILRQGVLHFECDASVDRNTRRRMGLVGPGAAVVTFKPTGEAVALSSDYPRPRIFRA